MSGSTFNYSGTISSFFVSTTGLYDTTAYGGQGGTTKGSDAGAGAAIRGTFSQIAEETLNIFVGGEAGYGGNNPGGSGGYGGGTAGSGNMSAGGSFDGGAFPGTVPPAGETSGAGAGDVQIVLEGAVCYLRGTRIQTPAGTVRVEDLRPGDAVVTRFNNVQPVRWIGRQSFHSCFVITDRSLIPVRIHAGALGADLPARDLYVSPGHAVLIKNTLVLAASLVNGVTITQDWVPEVVEYFQIDLGMHDCVIAEGAWCETFADGPGLRDLFENHAEFYDLYPQSRPPETVTLCAPRPLRGEKLAAAVAPVAARAASRVTPGRLRGVFARVAADSRLIGWAQDETYPDLPVLLEVLSEDQVIGTVLACEFREDLRAAGLAEGRCAFTFNAPERLRPEQIASLRIRRAADGAELWMMDSGAHVPVSAAGLQLAA